VAPRARRVFCSTRRTATPWRWISNLKSAGT
jgi:hypothetical protein